MHIHTVKRGESIFGIAREYAVSPAGIIEYNGLENPDVLAVGEELLILTPTRSYTAHPGDTVGSVARRFGISREEIFSANPALLGDDRLYDGRQIALGYGDARLGMAASNGYLYRDSTEESLRCALPYLTYLSVASSTAKGGRITPVFKADWAIKMTKERGKIPLLRIFCDGCREIYESEERSDLFIRELISAASDGGYSGLTLSAPEEGVEEARYEQFILKLRMRMIGSGLILFTEASPTRSYSYADYADGCVLSYGKLCGEALDFEHGERTVFTQYAEECESSKTFLDIASFATSNGSYIGYRDAVRTAAKVGAEIKRDPDLGICRYSYKKRNGDTVEVEYESLANIKAKLELLGELGYMGISFDVGRTPIAHLMAYSALFSGICYTSVFGQI